MTNVTVSARMQIMILCLIITSTIASCKQEKPAEQVLPLESNSFTCTGDTIIVDPRDGRSYKIVKIGDQCWFAENLRYENGITHTTNTIEWAAIWNNNTPLYQPAWCYYNDDAANDSIYGKLYNWTAAQMGSLCPEGWHIPSDEEWTILTDYLGGEEIAGGKMKSITGWNNPNLGATNESGFNGLPAGTRTFDGQSVWMGEFGYWWSKSSIADDQAWGRILGSQIELVIRSDSDKSNGFACRCVAD